MSLLFINAAFRDGSRTLELAKRFLKKRNIPYKTIELGKEEVLPLNAERLETYNSAVASHCFNNKMFDFAKDFRDAEEIVIAAPYWNMGFPAVLHAYFELVCTQGVSFDLSEKGEYVSLCKAKKLTYITTSGGYIPEDDTAFAYIKTLARMFWNNPEINYYKAEGLDIWGTDVKQKLDEVL